MPGLFSDRTARRLPLRPRAYPPPAPRGTHFLAGSGDYQPFAWNTIHLEFIQGSAHPIFTVFRLLGSLIGVPFIVLAATSPLLQAWWARCRKRPHPVEALRAVKPGLAPRAWPLPNRNRAQLDPACPAGMWTCGFGIFVLLSMAITRKVSNLVLAGTALPAADDSSLPPSPLKNKLLWLLLPMGASMQLSAVTAYLTANVAAIPLLWILPLGVYLITLILAFQFSNRIPRGIVGRLIVFLASLGFMLSHIDVSWPMRVAIIVFPSGRGLSGRAVPACGGLRAASPASV